MAVPTVAGCSAKVEQAPRVPVELRTVQQVRQQVRQQVGSVQLEQREQRRLA